MRYPTRCRHFWERSTGESRSFETNHVRLPGSSREPVKVSFDNKWRYMLGAMEMKTIKSSPESSGFAPCNSHSASQKHHRKHHPGGGKDLKSSAATFMSRRRGSFMSSEAATHGRSCKDFLAMKPSKAPQRTTGE